MREKWLSHSSAPEVGHFDVAEHVCYLPSTCFFSSGDRREMGRRSPRKVTAVAISCSRASSWPRDGTQDSLPSEPPEKPPKKLWVYPINVTPSHEPRHEEINQDQFQENKQRRFIQSLLEQGRQPGPLYLAEVPKQRAAGMRVFPGEERGRKIPASCSEAADLGELEVGQLERGGRGGGGVSCVLGWESRSVVSNSLRLHGLQPARLLCPWNSPGQNPGVGSHSLLQGIFPTQGCLFGFLCLVPS